MMTSYPWRHRVLVGLLLLIVGCMWGGAAWAQQSVTVPVHVTLDGIVLRGMVRDKPLDVIVDTGFSGFLLSSQAARRLGLHFDQRAVEAGQQQRVSLSAIQFGTARLKPVDAVVGTLPEGLHDGILGVTLFQQFVVTIDYDHQTLTLTPPHRYKPPAGATVLPLRIVNTTPQVRMTVLGVTDWFKVDTGSGGTLSLFAPFIKKNRIRERVLPGLHMMAGQTLSGPIYGDFVRVPEVALGPFHLNGVVTELLGDSPEGYFTGSDASGNIGAQLLRRFVVSFDYAHQRMCLTRGAALATPFSGPRTGFAVSFSKGTCHVIEVLPNSPASQAGLIVQDTILAFAGKPMTSSQHERLRRASRGAVGSTLHLTVQTGDEPPRTVVIVLRELL